MSAAHILSVSFNLNPSERQSFKSPTAALDALHKIAADQGARIEFGAEDHEGACGDLFDVEGPVGFWSILVDA